jgi:hypothetical protein
MFENIPWIGDLLISAVGALIAFYSWNWYHGPFLVATGVELNKVITEREDRNPGFRTRLLVKNIGRVPARNCEASIWLMRRNSEPESEDGEDPSEHLYVISSQSGWVNQRDSPFATHSDYQQQMTIPPGDTREVELYRQTHTGQFSNSSWVAKNISTAEIYTDKIQTGVENRLGDDILISGGRGGGDIYSKISSGIDAEGSETTRWEQGEVRIVGKMEMSFNNLFHYGTRVGKLNRSFSNPKGRSTD